MHGTGKQVPLHERSERELTGWIVGFPLIGGGVVVWAVVNVIRHEFTTVDRLFQVGWAVVVGLVLIIGLPATAWRELKRRRGQ